MKRLQIYQKFNILFKYNFFKFQFNFYGDKKMDIIQAIILGIVQGLAEFLPIASAGQVIIVTHILNVTFPNPSGAISFNTLLHLGTLTAVVGFFWRDLIKIIKAFVNSLLNLFQGTFMDGLTRCT